MNLSNTPVPMLTQIPNPNRRFIHSVVLGATLAALISTPSIASAASIVNYNSGDIHQAIPDDSATGFASTISIWDVGTVIGVNVHFELSMPEGEVGWLGDLYAYLRHDDGIAVLLNRPGRTASDSFGYSDSHPIDITFADGAFNGDIHGYRTTLFGNETTPLDGTLEGSWAPDGRAVDPDEVVDTDLRTALLSGFAGHRLDGDWTLFVADMSSGGLHQLDSWGMEIEVQPSNIPEPGTTAAVLLSAALLAIKAWRKRGRKRGRRRPAVV